MPRFANVRIESNQSVARDVYLLRLAMTDEQLEAQPGQFVNLYLPHPLQIFPRPFSIAGFEGDRLLILYKKVGQLTAYLADLPVGTSLKILGPLGNRFTLTEHFPVLVAGGVGLAPLLYLHQQLEATGREHTLIIGARTAAELPDLPQIGAADYLTDDGTSGRAGTGVDFFRAIYADLPKPLTVYTCGPEAMLTALWRLSRQWQFNLQVAVERIMACGMGLCQGCAIKIRLPDGSVGYKLVCKDGPVFSGAELSYDD